MDNNVLETIWDNTTAAVGGVMRGFEKGITSIFGSSNTRYTKKLEPIVGQINELESRYEGMSDGQLREQSDIFRKRLADGETLDDILPEAFAVCREGGKRFLGMRHYDVQMMGGIVLHRGNIAEMVTGEGKTLVATLPSYLNALEGKGVHVVTVNDYLARRDMEWMGPLHLGLGVSVAAIQANMDVLTKQKAYSCNITYGTNNEFGFDYLRDNMRPAARGDKNYPYQHQQSQGRLRYAIIDEVDNILIDEARTPLIISGPAHDDISKYPRADKVARQLKRGEVDEEGVESGDFIVNEKDHHVHMTDEGVRKAEKLAGVESFYTAGNMEWPHLIDNALKAHYLYKLDVDYVVKDGGVVIVDSFTGRLMEGRQWSDGLHQAVEAKEGVKIKEESQTLATITLQNFFKLYDKISGMTGTAMTEANEFWKIYELDVVAIPTNREMQRIEHPDVIFCSEGEKYVAVAEEIERMNRWDVIIDSKGNEHCGTIADEDEDSITFQAQGSKQKQTFTKGKSLKVSRKGRPILIGTTSIEKSERIAGLLEKRGVKHEVLNAKQHKREAEIVAQAGRKGAVTIATNMAGRGTDIILGGNPETLAWAQLQDKYPTRLEVPAEEWDALVEEIDQREGMTVEGEEVKKLGGLHVVATERHEARRIDLQLRGRCGRQGDPGSSRFFLSLEDDLMRMFFGTWVKSILPRLGMKEGEAIESAMVSRRISGAQKKREEMNFEQRKQLLEYDEVRDEQRKRFYGYRQAILDGANCKSLILEMIEDEIDDHLDEYLQRDFGVESFTEYVGSKLSTSLDAKQFRGMDFESAEQFARDEAERMAESYVLDAMDENLPAGEDESEWNWAAIARTCNTRWGISVRDRDLIKMGRDNVDQFLVEKAREAIGRIDLSSAEKFLHEDFGLRTALAWVNNKFGLDIAIDEVREVEPPALKQLVLEKAEAAYDQKESEYPVMAGLYRYSKPAPGGHTRIDRDGLVAWAQQRFEVELSDDDLKNKQREEIRDLLVVKSQQHQKKASAALAKVHQKVGTLYGDSEGDVPLQVVSGGNGALESLSGWLKDELDCEFSPDDLGPLDRERLERHLSGAVEEVYRPEMRRMERQLLLEIIDSAWKDHLLAMDYLRSAVGMRGYAQVDPKVEYKREGMKQFERMWSSIGQRVTDLIFKMEQLPEDFVGSTWKEANAVHEEAASMSDIARQQQAAMDGMQNDPNQKLEPIRRVGQKVGRNDPCPCGSGKKYKNCCAKK